MEDRPFRKKRKEALEMMGLVRASAKNTRRVSR